MSIIDDLNQISQPEDVVEDFLASFGQKCVGFGYYCDQYMREEINLGEITRRMSEATAEGESFFEIHHAMMSPQQVNRYHVMQQTLDSMTTDLIETEIKRNRQVISEALSKGEYFIVNITFNSIQSSIYMVYSTPGQSQQGERDRKLAALQQEQELAQALMKVLKVIDQKVRPEHFDEQAYHKVIKAFQIYVEYFKRIEPSPIKSAADERVVLQFTELADYLESKDYFGNRQLAYDKLSLCYTALKDHVSAERLWKLDKVRERLRPPSTSERLDQLFQEVLAATTEANIYSAVVAFNNFIQAHPNEPAISRYKREVQAHIKRLGFS